MPDRLQQELPPPDSAAAAFDLGDWHVDPSRGTISRCGVVRRVQPRVMDLLCILAHHPHRTLTRQQLLTAVWGDVHVVNAVVWRCISLARAALGDDPDRPRYIQTIPRRGYRLVAAVRHRPASLPTSTPLAEPNALVTVAVPRLAATAAVVVAVGLAIALQWGPGRGETAALPAGAESELGALRTASDYTRSGREYYRRYEPADLDRAAVQFQRALELEPEHAPALAGLADTYVLLSAWGGDRSLAESALESARRALEIDPRLPEAYRSLGLAQLLRGRTEASLQASLRALALRSSWAAPMHNVAAARAALGQLDQAVIVQRQVVAADPRGASWGRLAWLSGELGLKDGTLASAQEALRRQPFEAQATAALAALELEAGRPDRAWAAIEPALALSPRPPILLKAAARTRLAMDDLAGAREHFVALSAGTIDPAADLGNLFVAAIDLMEGRADDGRARLSRARELSLAAIRSGDERWEPLFQLAVYHAANGQPRAAHRWLERAIDRGFRDYRWLEVDSIFSVVGLPTVAVDHTSDLRDALRTMRIRATSESSQIERIRFRPLVTGRSPAPTPRVYG